jgi:hypothetical protein
VPCPNASWGVDVSAEFNATGACLFLRKPKDANSSNTKGAKKEAPGPSRAPPKLKKAGQQRSEGSSYLEGIALPSSSDSEQSTELVEREEKLFDVTQQVRLATLIFKHEISDQFQGFTNHTRWLCRYST